MSKKAETESSVRRARRSARIRVPSDTVPRQAAAENVAAAESIEPASDLDTEVALDDETEVADANVVAEDRAETYSVEIGFEDDTDLGEVPAADGHGDPTGDNEAQDVGPNTLPSGGQASKDAKTAIEAVRQRQATVALGEDDIEELPVDARTTLPMMPVAEPEEKVTPPPTPPAAPPPTPEGTQGQVEDDLGVPAAVRGLESGRIISPVSADKDGPPPPPSGKPPPTPISKAVQAAATRGTGPRRTLSSRPWFEEIFDEDYLRTLPFLTPQATQAEATFVADSLGLSTGAQVLDIGCGYGRHAMELAARGFHVVALDLSLPLLLRGADEAQRRGLDINFVHGDMRELSFDAQFDGAYCLFSTFGYFDDDVNRATMQNIARALKPGAKLIVEVLNRDYLITDLPARVWWEGDGCVVLEEVGFNYFTSRVLSSRSVVFDDGRQLEQEISLRAYSLHEFGHLLHVCGFKVLEVSGAMITRGRFFGNQSRDLIVLAERIGADDDKS